MKGVYSKMKWVYSKRKEFAPVGSKFFPFRVDLFQNGSRTILIELSPLKVYQFFLRVIVLCCIIFLYFWNIFYL